MVSIPRAEGSGAESFDDATARPLTTRMALALAAVFSIVVVAFGLVGLFAPSIMLPSADPVTAGVRFFGALIAARNIPLGLAAIYVILRRDHLDPAIVLVLSAIVQLGDTVLGLSHGLLAMGISAAVGAALYTVAAVFVSMTRRAIRA